MGKEMQKDKEPRSVYDDTYRTIVAKMPQYIVPLINEMFGTSYQDDTEVIQIRNEHTDRGDTIITDSKFLVDGHLYHVECQSTDDDTMAFRMFRYDTEYAMEHAEKEEDGRSYKVVLPSSGVVYVVPKGQIPDQLTVTVCAPETSDSLRYNAKVMKSWTYTAQEIGDKNLMVLAPYYMTRYVGTNPDRNAEAAAQANADLSEIVDVLKKQLYEAGKSLEYEDMLRLLQDVSDHVFRKDKDFRKGVDQYMGGKILELPSDRVKNAWKQGSEETLIVGVAEGGIDEKYAADKLNISVPQLLAKVKQYKETVDHKEMMG